MAGTEKMDYSNLEVDERAQRLNEAKLYAESLPQVKPNTDLPELKPNRDLPEVMPISEPPQVIEQVDKEAAFPGRRKKFDRGIICGLCRRNFWIFLGFVALVVIGIAVGVGVGMTRKGSSGDSRAMAEKRQRAISPWSQLAAANYTDQTGAVHSQVYFQDNSLQIQGADWDSSNNTWTVSHIQPIDNRTAINPRNGTPIAAYNWWWGDNSGTSDFRCLFIDNSSYIRSLCAPSRAVAGWRVADVLDAVLSATDDSPLVEHTAQCPGCDASDFTGYRARSGDQFKMQYPFGNGVSGAFLPDAVAADAGTAMAVAPAPVVGTGEEVLEAAAGGNGTSVPRVALYLVGGGRLVELWGMVDARWNGSALNSKRRWLAMFVRAHSLTIRPGQGAIPVDGGAKLAAMSQIRADALNIQVMMTRSNGGVNMAYTNGTSWEFAESVAGMEDVLPLSPIAATQTGRVFALESGPQIVEWRRVDGDDPTFERVGPIEVANG